MIPYDLTHYFRLLSGSWASEDSSRVFSVDTATNSVSKSLFAKVLTNLNWNELLCAC